MSLSRKRLGASAVTANTDTSLYATPSNTETVVSTVLVCNRGSSAAHFRLAHVDGAIGSVASEDYLFYDSDIAPNDSVILTLGITMSAADSLLVRSDSTSVSFVAWGIEKTSGGTALGATPNYIPPSMIYKDTSNIYVPIGNYYKMGYRVLSQYQDFDRFFDYWNVASTFTVQLDATYATGGTPSSGMIGGAKVNSSWYSVFMLGNQNSAFVVLPYLRVKAVDYNATHTNQTTVNPGDHDTGGSYENGFLLSSDAWNNYRLVKIDTDLTNGIVLNIDDSTSATNDEVIFNTDQVSAGVSLVAGDWLQMIPPVGPCLYLGSVRFNGSGNLVAFSYQNWLFTYSSTSQAVNLNKASSSSLVNTDLASAIPPLARRVQGWVSLIESTSCRGVVGRFYSGISGSNQVSGIEIKRDTADTNTTLTSNLGSYPLTAVTLLRNHCAYLDGSDVEQAITGTAALNVVGFEE
jgi:hypothetical protein